MILLNKVNTILIFSSVFLLQIDGAFSKGIHSEPLSHYSTQRIKPRIIVTTDGEVDDRSSMIRFLMYACDFDVEGIVQVNSKFQKSGHSREKWIEAQLDEYEKLLPNLRKHHPDYPDVDSLRNVIRIGNENSADLYRDPPDMAVRDTPGAQLIIDTLLDDDPRPLHVPSWGGANTTAYALWKLKTAYTPEQFNYAVSRIRIYCIWYQDGGGKWIEENIREAYINEAYRWDNVWDYQSIGSRSENPFEIQRYMSGLWLRTNVKKEHGPLGAMTPQEYISEGDTPSFLHLVNNGLESHADYTLGGWGGRSVYDDPVNKPNHITDGGNVNDDGDRNKMYWRWVIAAQNDFAARMDWCVATEYDSANHQPVAAIVGDNVRTVSPGETIILDASPSTDPDGDSLSYNWWQYYNADNAKTTVTITDTSSINNAGFTVPNESGKQVHIILEVTDHGTPSLKSYQRIIFNIDDAGTGIGQEDADSNMPESFALNQNYPNPFNPQTTIQYQLPLPQHVSLKIFDLNGRLVETLVNGTKNAGNYKAHWNGQDHAGNQVSGGVYFYRLQTKQFTKAGRAVLIK